MTTVVNSDLGSDFHCDTDIDANLSTVEGRRCLAEALARRLQTPKGMYFPDKHYGFDISEYVGSSVPEAVIKHGIRKECLKDERVLDASVELNTVQVAGQMVLAPEITVTDSQGTFTFTATPSDAGLVVELLKQ